MDEATIEYKVAEFAAELDVWDSYSGGEISADDANHWYHLVVQGYDAQELLKSVHRHVTIIREAVQKRKRALFLQHLEMLSVVSNEIERRRIMTEDDEKDEGE